MNKKIFLLLSLLALFLPAVIKAFYISNYIYLTAGVNTGFWQSLASDAVIYAVIYTLLILSFSTFISFYTSIFLRLIAAAALALYCVDFYLIENFSVRLAFEDIPHYIHYVPKYLMQTSSLAILGLLIIAFGILIAIIFFPLRNAINARASYISIALLVVVTFIFQIFKPNNNYVHSWLYHNLIIYNKVILDEGNEYEKKYEKDIYQEIQQSCEEGDQYRPNVIVLMVESLSNYQSKLFSGINDWTPNLDAIAKDNQFYRRFYANGFVTEDGEIALLKGMFPISPPQSFTRGGGQSFEGFYGYKNALPVYFSNAGYKTSFLTTADLDFSHTGEWAKSVGFHHVEGHENESYNSWPRLQFNAAPDEALYERIINYIDDNSGGRQFIFVKTATSHHPFINPVTGRRSEEETFRYVDKQLNIFYKKLEKINFFEDGMLIVVGDHRAMVPVSNNENIQSEGHAHAMIPLVVVGDKFENKKVEDSFQQTDVHNSLKAMVTGKYCHSDWFGLMFGKMKPPSYIVHKPGKNRAMIDVFHKGQALKVKLDGDDTMVERPSDGGSVSNSIVNVINSLRSKDEFDPVFVAHAGGRINGIDYTNSYRAMENSYQKGIYMLEIEFSWTSDGKLVCLHDWGPSLKNIYDVDRPGRKDEDFFDSLLVKDGGYKPCKAESLNAWLVRHPLARIVTDMKERNIEGLKLLARHIDDFNKKIIPQVYHPAEYQYVKEIGYEDIIFTVYRLNASNMAILKSLDDKDYFAITMPFDRVASGLSVSASYQGLRVFVHTINDIGLMKKLLSNYQVDGFYTDVVDPESFLLQ